MVTGTNRMTYKPGERLPESLPVEAGVYELQLSEYGKKGRQGWAAKPGKFHNRRVVFEIIGTQDELTGLPKKVSEFLTLGPKNLFRVLNLAQAARFPEELSLRTDYSKPGAPASLENADAIDQLLTWLKSEKLVLRAQLGTDEYQGRETNRIQRWLDVEEDGTQASESSSEDNADGESEEDAAESADGEETEATEEDGSEAEGEEGEATEEEAESEDGVADDIEEHMTKPGKKPASKPTPKPAAKKPAPVKKPLPARKK